MDMNNFEINQASSQTDPTGQQLTMAAQLLKIIVTMNHMDQLFQWISAMVARHLQTQVTEIWSVQQSRMTGQFAIQLRALACLDASLPQHIVTNNYVAAAVDNFFRGQRSYPLEQVSNVFPAYQTSLLKRYGLHYCSSHLIESNVLLPPASDRMADNLPAPFRINVFFFLHHPPAQDIATTINFVLEQAIQAASSRGLLVPMSGPSGETMTPPIGSISALPPINPITPPIPSGPRVPSAPFPSHPSRPTLMIRELVPRRRMDADLLKSSNPLSGAVDIADKQARRLYAAIDGRKSINELSIVTHQNLNETIAALQKLLAQKRVEVLDPDGKLVDFSSHF